MKILKIGVALCLMAVLLTFGTLVTHAQEQESPQVSLSVFAQSMDLTTNTTTLTLRVNNPFDQPLSCVFYTILRTPDGLPDSCERKSVTLQSGNQGVVLPHTFQSTYAQADLTVYCWNTNMQPLCDPLTLPVTFEQTVTQLTLTPNPNRLIVTTGQTATLSVAHQPSTLPAPSVTYHSLNEQVATVSAEGIVTPTGAGKTTLYALTADRTAYGTCEITVISDITRINLPQTQLTLGSATQLSGQLTPSVTPADAPEKRLTYQSANPAVATVDQNGLVKAVARGETTITVSTLDHSATAVCNVTVTEIITEIKLNQKQVNMWDYGDYLLVADVVAEGNYKITWSSSNPQVAEVTEGGMVFALKKGSAVITAAIGNVKATCTVTVHQESDYICNIAAYFETKDNPASISGSGNAKYYGLLQISAKYDAPKNFYNWLISSGTHPEIGGILKAAHAKDGGAYGTNFDTAWKQLGTNRREEFRSLQAAFGVIGYYDPVANDLAEKLGFYTDEYSIALKAAVLSRAIQHGTGGAFNRIRDALATLGNLATRTEREIITAIYKECGAVVDKPPSSTSVPMNSSSSIAVEYGLVGKYMKYYSSNSSSVQAGVWKRLNVTELNMLYDMLDHPPVVITR